MRLVTPLLALAVSAALVAPAGAFAPHESTADLEFRLAFEATPVVFRSTTLDALGAESARSLGAGWKVETSRYTGLVHFAYGGDRILAPGVSSEAVATDVAREFLLSQPELTAALPENVRVRNVKFRRSLWVVHFRQFENGIPVYGGDAFVAFADNGRLNAFGSDFFPRAENSPVAAVLGQAQAIETATSALGAVPRIGRPVEAELWYVPAPSGETIELTLAYRVRFETDQPFGEWETYVDAMNGTILARTNRIETVNVVGNVEADVQDFGYCDPNGTDALQNLTVNVTGGNSGQTDDDGEFDITHGGVANVGVTAALNGPFLNVDRGPGIGTDASTSATATPGTPFTLTFNDANSRQDERDTFFHANRAHDLIKSIDPSFTGMDYPMQCIVGSSSGICPGNAFWSPGAQSINFCVAGGGYGNTGEMGNVVYHEYGHGVSQLLYQ
jgi:Zn-dependent metalloprotease